MIFKHENQPVVNICLSSSEEVLWKENKPICKNEKNTFMILNSFITRE